MKKISLIGIFALLAGCSNSTFTSTNDAMGGGGSSTGGNEANSIDETGGLGVDETTATGGGGNVNTGGAGGSDTCTPQTCDEFSIEKTGESGRACGLIDDKCDGEFFCSTNFDDEPDHNCGTSILNDPVGKDALLLSHETEIEMTEKLSLGTDENILYGGIFLIKDGDLMDTFCEGSITYFMGAINSASTTNELTDKVEYTERERRQDQSVAVECTPSTFGNYDNWVMCCTPI